MKVNFTKEAEQDIKLIYEYYEAEANQEVANDFVLDLKHLETNLLTFPEMGRVYGSKNQFGSKILRKFGLKKFPHIVFYCVELDKGVIEIVRVMHSRLNFKL